MFFVIQIAFAIGWGSNQIILSSMIGPAEAASFSVLQRMFMIVQVALTILNLPLWAMYADAYAHLEIAFIRSLLKRSMAMTLLFSLLGVLVLILFQKMLVLFLSGDRIAIPQLTVVLMALWTVIEVCGISFSMYLNGVGRIRPQAVIGVVHTIVVVPAKILGVHFFGLNGLVTATIVCYIVFAAVPYLTIFRAECLGGVLTH
jgi:O-antigen/teichoic acid export membrane protein